MKPFISEHNKKALYHLQNISDAFFLKDLKLMHRKVNEANNWLNSSTKESYTNDTDLYFNGSLPAQNHVAKLIELTDLIEHKKFLEVIELIKSLKVKQFVKHADPRKKTKEAFTNDK